MKKSVNKNIFVVKLTVATHFAPPFPKSGLGEVRRT